MDNVYRHSTRATTTITLLLSLLVPALVSCSPFSADRRAEVELAASTSTPSYLSNSSSLDVVRGVNLGGWLVLESWITPSIFQVGATSYPDEWNLSAALGKQAALKALSSHWNSFITRDDFVEIKEAGLNAVRIPVGYWIQDLLPYEPYVSGQFPFLIRAVQWAGEVGINVLIDLHGAVGSQNGADHSGLVGPVEFMYNQTNVDRTLSVLKNLTAEFTQPQYGSVVTGIELLNEPRLGSNFTMPELKRFYSQASEIVRDDAVRDIEVVIHDAFWGPNYWSDYDPLSSSSSSSPSWLTLDTHQYYAFAPFENLPREEILQHVCNISRILKSTTSGVPKTIVGEWSLETGTPPNMTRPRNGGGLTQAKRTWFRQLFEAQLAAYTPNGLDQPSNGYYYWTWKTGDYPIDTWSYQYGRDNGYIPRDVSNASQLVFPVLEEGCIDAGFPYQAPERSGGLVRFESHTLAFSVVALGWFVSCF